MREKQKRGGRILISVALPRRKEDQPFRGIDRNSQMTQKRASDRRQEAYIVKPTALGEL